MTNLTRRAAMAGAVVSTIAVTTAAVPVVAEGEPDAKLLRLADELIAIRRLWDERAAAHYAAHGDDVAYDICDQPEAGLEDAINAQIEAIRPTTLQGFCVKMLVVTGFGDFDANDALVEDAMAISGFLPEQSHPRHPQYVPASA